MAYSELFNDHVANPRHAGQLDAANASSEQTNPVCGDRLQLSLRIKEGTIEAARFLAYGCAPTLACGSVMTEMIVGMSCAEAAGLTRRDIVRALDGLPSRKQHAAALAIEVLRAALDAKGSSQLPRLS